MLQNIRDNAQGLVAKIIIGLIVISFALFGVESLVGGGQENAAIVNGDEISVAELDQAINTQRNRMINAMGDNFDPAMVEDSRLKGPVLEQLIQKRLLLQTADSAAMGVSEASIDQMILGMQQFQQEGQFSPELFQSILRSNGLSPAYFKQLLQEDIVINQFNTAVAGSDFVTEKDLSQMATIIGQKRSFNYIFLPELELASEAAASPEEVENYYQEHPEQFQSEEQVRLDYIEVKLQDFFSEVSEEELRVVYEEELADFESSEERRVSHILIEISDALDDKAAHNKALGVISRIEQGEDFATLAEELSNDPGSSSNGGDLGYTSGDTFPPEFEDALFSLELNAVSEPVLTDAGYHVIKVTDIKGNEPPSYEQRLPILTQRLQADGAETEFVSVVEELRDFVFNSEGLAGPASELNLAHKQSDWLSRNTSDSLLGNARILEAAFSDQVLLERNNSEVIELASDHFIVISVVDHELPSTKDFDEVKNAIEQQLTAEKIAAMAQERADQLITNLIAGVSKEEVAKTLGAEWQTADAVQRNSINLDRQLLQSVFALQIEEGVFEAVKLLNGDMYIVEINEIEPGNLQDFSQIEQQGIRAELQRRVSNSSMTGFMSALSESADIQTL